MPEPFAWRRARARSLQLARAVLQDLAALVWPPSCLACGAPEVATPGALLCDVCELVTPWLEPGACIACQATSPPPATSECSRCAGRDRPLATTTAAVSFEGDVQRWIHDFKYPDGFDGGAIALAGGLAVRAAALSPAAAPDAVVPIPLHRTRLRERGFNPAAILARAVAKATGARLDANALERTRDTPSQTSLGREARQHNVHAAFATSARWRAARCVWLIDDVVTTGATLEAAADALRSAGVCEVHAICAARTPPQQHARAGTGGLAGSEDETASGGSAEADCTLLGDRWPQPESSRSGARGHEGANCSEPLDKS